jgi:hypothetical protein
VSGILASYCGTQMRTTDNFGRGAYGGSDLLVVRGGFEELARASLCDEARSALAQAQIFDAATDTLQGFFASRRNYDAVCARDGRGQIYCRILEQSWRIGGASSAEVAAIAVFQRDPARRMLRARSTEAYGVQTTPAQALVQFSGRDEELGELVKYSEVELDEAQD